MSIPTPSARPNLKPSEKLRCRNVAIGQKRFTKPLSVKRLAVKTAHEKICQLLQEFNVSLVKKTFGLGVVRVCSRTIDQMENIDTIVEHFLKHELILEIGMPLKHNPNMKSLVLFIKPKDIHACIKMKIVFRSFGYSNIVLETTAPEKAFAEAPSSVIGKPIAFANAEVQISTAPKTKESAEANKMQQFRSLMDICAKEEASKDETGAKHSQNELFIILAAAFAAIISLIFFQRFLS